ncbi:SAM-dependent methyltransferase [Nocardia sp. CDC153]|uniref:class I SAM-dependent methyltransferase n=1 Tax=Nocardia sp. CDC153 TaxID=3112167 RepID=UPI002DB71496|nr:SAM-dependent methyltransferase [Nocardia sp. CDC153]MEC3955526.1 SAM-dependent methyltransferase [Nocardia sp. CDC153]
MATRAADTPLIPMLIAAAESAERSGNRLLTDDLAIRMLPLGLRPLVRNRTTRGWLRKVMAREGPGLWDSLACRKRYFDEQTDAAVRAGVGAVVVLGAGLDTRATRLVAAAGVPVFEVDLPVNIELKRRRIALPDNVVQVAIDFETQDLATTLAERGYRGERTTLFLWEGVTQYLTEKAVRATLATLAAAPAGSRLVFSYVRQDFLDGTNLEGCDGAYRRFVAGKGIWRFGLLPGDVAELLAEYGWRELEQVGGREYVERFLAPLGRGAEGVPDLERCVTATKV